MNIQISLNRAEDRQMYVISGFHPSEVERIRNMPEHKAMRIIYGMLGKQIVSDIENRYGLIGVCYGLICIYVIVGV